MGLGISGNAESAYGVSGRNAYRISCLYPRLPIITLPHLQTVLSERQSRTSEFRNLDTRSVCAALSYSNKRLLLFFRGVSIYTVKLSFHVMTGLRGMKKRKGLECSVRLCDAATQVFLFLYRK